MHTLQWIIHTYKKHGVSIINIYNHEFITVMTMVVPWWYLFVCMYIKYRILTQHSLSQACKLELVVFCLWNWFPEARISLLEPFAQKLEVWTTSLVLENLKSMTSWAASLELLDLKEHVLSSRLTGAPSLMVHFEPTGETSWHAKTKESST